MADWNSISDIISETEAEVCTALLQCSLVYRLLRSILEKNCFCRKK